MAHMFDGTLGVGVGGRGKHRSCGQRPHYSGHVQPETTKKLHPCISGFSARVSIVSLVSKLIDEDMYEPIHPIHLNTKLYASNISRLAGM